VQVLAELLQSQGSDTPPVAELKIDHRIGGSERVRQKALQPLELFLRAGDGALLLFEPIEKLETLTLETAEFPFHAGAIPIQPQKLFVGRLTVPV
jgi:hypothetical protein